MALKTSSGSNGGTSSNKKSNTIRIKSNNGKTRNTMLNYMRNIAKSTSYVTLETIENNNPAIKNFIDSNSDLSRSMYSAIKEYKSIYKAITHKVKESEYYKIGKAGINNAIEDLKTGNFYNKERESQIQNKLFDSDDSLSFSDEDFNLDFDFDFDDTSNEEILDKKDKVMIKEMDDVAHASVSALGTTTIESAKYIAGTQRASTKMLYDQNNRLLGGLNVGVASLNANMQQIVASQTAVINDINEAKIFRVETTKELKKTNEILEQLLENSNKAYAIQEEKEKEKIRFSDIDNGMGSVDLKAYFNNIKKNAKNLDGGLSSLMNMFEGGNILETFAASPLKFIIDKSVNAMIPKMLKQTSEHLNESISGMFGSFQAILKDMAENGTISEQLYNLLHVRDDLKRTIDPSKYNKAQTVWTGVDHKALTEVIPDQLSEIISILSGTEKRLFDYDKGRYTTVSKVRKDFNDSITRSALSASGDVMADMNKMLQSISFENKSDIEDMKKSIISLFENAFKESKFLDIYNKDFDLGQLGVDKRYEKYILAMLKNVDSSAMLKYNTSVREAREKFTKDMIEREKSGNSLYRYLTNDSELRPNLKTDKKGRLKNDNSLLSNLSIAKVEDNLGHNIFYYLQNMYKELSYIRQSSGFSADGYGNYGRATEIVTFDEYGRERVINTNYNGHKIKYNDISIENTRSKEQDRESLRALQELQDYEKKRKKELKENKNLHKIEDLEELNDKQLAGRFQSIIQESREREGIINVRPVSSINIMDELAEAEDVTSKAKVIANNIKELAQKPTNLLASAMQAADKALYTIIYGDDRTKDGKRKGLMQHMLEQMQITFTKFHNWMDSLLNPIKEKLGVNQFREVPGKLFEHVFGVSPHEVWTDLKQYLFGAYEVDELGNKVRTKDGIFSFIGDGIKDAFSDFGNFVKESFSPITEYINGKKKPKEENKQEESEEEEESSVPLTPAQVREQLTEKKKNITRKNKNKIDNLVMQEGFTVTPENAALVFAGSNIEDLYGNNNGTGWLTKDKRNRRNRKIAEEALKIERGRYNDNVDFLGYLLNNTLSDNKKINDNNTIINKRNMNKLNSYILNSGRSLDNITIEELSAILNSGEVGNAQLKVKLNSMLKKDPSIKDMTFKEFKGDFYEKFADENSNKVPTIDKLAQERLENQRKSIQDVLEATSVETNDNFNNISNVTSNIENILEDILDTIRFIAGKKIRGALPNKRERRLFKAPIFNGPIRTEEMLQDIESRMSEDINSISEEELDYYNRHKYSGVMAVGGRVPKTGPYILSEGEYVFNPAGSETRKKQAKNEMSIAKRISKYIDDNILMMADPQNPQSVEGTASSGDSNKVVDTGRVDSNGRAIYSYKGEEYYLNSKQTGYKKIGDDSNYYILKNGEFKLKEKREGLFNKWDRKVQAGEYNEGEEPVMWQAKNTLSNAVQATAKAIGITDDDEHLFGKAATDIMVNVKRYAPYAIGTGLIGGGIGLMSGLTFGPILGATAGAAIGIAKKSSEVQNWLFGEIGEDGERKGGVISKKVQDQINKYLPDMLKFGTVGGVGGLITGLISPVGPVGGLMIGSAIGFAKNNEEIKKTLFGDEDWENKSKEFEAKIKKMVPSSIAGALVGGFALSGTFGLVPALTIGGIAGILSNTEPIKRALFGRLNPDGTRDNTGLFGAIKEGIVEPIKNHSRDIFKDIKNWLRKDIFDPVKKAIAPIGTAFKNVFGSIFGFFRDKITDSFDSGLSTIFAKWLKENIFGKTARRVGKAGKIFLSPAKALVSAPFRAVGAVGDHLRGRQIAHGQANYMTAQERIDYRDERLKKHKGFFGRALRGDKFDEFDNYINNASDEELKELRSEIQGFQGSDDYLRSETNDAHSELVSSVYRSKLSVKDSRNVLNAIESGDYDKARTIIGNSSNLNSYTRDRLMHQIFSAGANYNALNTNRNIVKNIGRASLSAIRNSKAGNGIFKGLSSYKDLDKYEDYLNREIKVREQKSDVEEQTDLMREQHSEIVDLFKEANDNIKAITDPKFKEALQKKRKEEAREAANKRYGRFSNLESRLGRNRASDALMYDYFDDEGNETDELNYVGPGSAYHKMKHPEDYDANGKYKYDRRDLNGPATVSDLLFGHRHQRKIDQLALSLQQREGLTPKQAKDKAKELLANKDRKGFWENFDGIRSDIKLSRQGRKDTTAYNTAQDLASLDGKDYDSLSKEEKNAYLDQARGLGRKEIRENSEKAVRNKLIQKYRSKYVNDNTPGQISGQMSLNFDNDIESAEDMADEEIAKARSKKKWYHFVGLRRFKMKLDESGAPIIDRSDSVSVKNQQDLNQSEETQSKTYTVLSAMHNSVKGFFSKLVGGDEENGKVPLWKKLIKFGFLKVMGAWTLLSLGPYLKKFAKETLYPAIKPFIEPIVPTLVSIKDNVIDFFTNKFPTTIQNIATSIIEWGTGTGRFTGSGLPYVFRDKIVPFYMGGLEFLMNDIIPNTVGLFFKHLPAMLLNTAKSIGKVLSWDLSKIADLIHASLSGKSSTASISSVDTVNDIGGAVVATGAFAEGYNYYASRSNSTNNNITGETATIDVNDVIDNSSNDYADEEVDTTSFKYKVKDLFGLNTTKERAVASQNTINKINSNSKTKYRSSSNESSLNINNTSSYSNSNGLSTNSSSSSTLYADYTGEDYAGVSMSSEFTGDTITDNPGYEEIQNEDGTTSVVDINTGEVVALKDNSGTMYITDSYGNVREVGTNQKWIAGSDGLYHSVDANGKDVTLTLGQLPGYSYNKMKNDFYNYFQNDELANKTGLKLLGSSLTTRGTLGNGAARAIINGKSGIIGGLSKVGAKGGFITRTLTSPLRNIGEAANNLSQITRVRTTAGVAEATRNMVSNTGEIAGQMALNFSDDGVARVVQEGAERAVQEGAEQAARGTTKMGKLKNIWSKVTSKVVRNSADDVVEKAAESTFKNDTIVGKISKAISERIGKISTNGKIKSVIYKVFGNGADSVFGKFMKELGEKLTKNISNKLLKSGIANATKFIGKFSPAALAFIVMDFWKGWNDAQIYLGILREPTMGERLLAALVTVINSYITFGLLPERTIYDLVLAIAPNDWFSELRQDRDSAEEYLKLYNEVNGTSYSNVSNLLEDEKLGFWGGIGESLFGESEKTKKFREKREKVNRAIVQRSYDNYAINTFESNLKSSSRALGNVSQSVLDKVKNEGKGSGLLLSSQNATGAFGFNQMSTSIKPGTFISQNSEEYKSIQFGPKNHSQTIAEAGCGPASAAMVVNDAINGVDNTSKSSLDKDKLMNSAIGYASNSNYFGDNGGITTNFFKDYFNTNGLTSVEYKTKFDIQNQIENGSRMIVLGKDATNKQKANSPFGPNGHYVVVNGMSRDNKYVFVNDPELQTPNIPYSANMFFKGIQYGVKAINPKTRYNTSNKVGRGANNIFENAEFATLYQDLCTWSNIGKNTFKNTVKNLCPKKKPDKNIFVNKSDIFLTAAKESYLDPRFLLALAVTVSDWGTNEYVTTYNNPFAIMSEGNKNPIQFASVEDGIIEGAKYIEYKYYYVENRYCLLQMATNTITGCAGQPYVPAGINDWYKKVAKLMVNPKMPKNSNTVTYLEAKPSKCQAPDLSGNPVYDVESDKPSALNFISSLGSIIGDLFNAIFGFSTEDEEEDENVIEGARYNYNSNGHTYACYCEKCHPEMYKDGKPISTKSIIFQYALGKKGYYSDITTKENKEKEEERIKQYNKYKDMYAPRTDINNSTTDVTRAIANDPDIKYIYDLLEVPDNYRLIGRDLTGVNINKSELDNLNRYINKTFLLGALSKMPDPLITKNTLKPFSSTLKMISTTSPFILDNNYQFGPIFPGIEAVEDYVDSTSAFKYNKNGIYDQDYIIWNKINKDGLNSNNLYNNLYRSIIWRYLLSSGTIDNTDLYAGVTATLNSYLKDPAQNKPGYNDYNPDIFLHVTPNGNISDINDLEARNKLVDLYKNTIGTFKTNIDYSGFKINDKYSLLEKTNTFDPTDKNLFSIKLTPYKKSGDKLPNVFIAEANYKSDIIPGESGGENDRGPFKTSLFGIPVYGISNNEYDYKESIYKDATTWYEKLGAGIHKLVTPKKDQYKTIGVTSKYAWQNPYYDESNKHYKSSYVNAWRLDKNLEEFKKSIGLIATNEEKEDTTKYDKYQIDPFLLDNGNVKDDLVLIKDKHEELYFDYKKALEEESKIDLENITDTDIFNGTAEALKQMRDSAINAAKNATSSDNNYVDENGNITNDGGGSRLLFGKGSGLIGGSSFISQLDPRYSNIKFNTSNDTHRQTLGEAGCAPAVATMAINAYNGGASMVDMANKALKYKVKNGGTTSDYFSDVFSQNGISSSYTKSKSDIKNSLKRGHSVVLLGQDKNNRSKANSPFGPGGHYVLATGISKDGSKVTINDPESSVPGLQYSSSILNNANVGVTVGGSSRLFKRFYGGSTLDNMHIGNNGLNLIKEFESFQSHAYHGKNEKYWTIGYGHYSKDVKPSDVVTEEQALKLLAGDCSTAEAGVKRHLKSYYPGFIPTQNQFDALVSYEFNRGCGAAEQLYRNTSKPEDLGNNMPTYWGSNTAVKKGLVRRRNAEKELFYSNASNFVPSGNYSTSTDSSSSSTSTSSNAVSSSSGNSPLSVLGNTASKLFNSLYGENVGSGSRLRPLSKYSKYSGSGKQTLSSTKSKAGEMMQKLLGYEAIQFASGNFDYSSNGVSSTTNYNDYTIVGNSSLGIEIAKKALEYVGKVDYSYGAKDIDGSHKADCSGFVWNIMQKFGYTGGYLYTKAIYDSDAYGPTISDISSIQAGDILLFSNNGSRSGVHHTGIAINSTQMVHMPYTGRKCSVGKFSTKEFICAKRPAASGSGSGLSGISTKDTDPTDILRYYSSTDGFGSKIIKTKNHSTSNANSINNTITKLNSYIGSGSSIDPQVLQLIRSCISYLSHIDSNTKQVTTIVKLLSKIVTKKSGSGSGLTGKGSETTTNTTQPIIMNSPTPQIEGEGSGEDPELTAMISKLAELAK